MNQQSSTDKQDYGLGSSNGESSWRGQADEFSQRAREFVASKPLAALGIAVATGFIVGRIIRR